MRAIPLLYFRSRATGVENPCMAFDPVAGVVLVGTHSWRRSAFDRLPPRPLIPVAHRPLISYSLAWLRDCGISNVIVCANRETQVLESRLLRHVPEGMAVSYQEDAMPRGAAGAVRDAAAASDADTFVVAEGTAIPNVDLRELLHAHRASGAVATVVGYAAPSRDGQAGAQMASGIYVFNRDALDAVPLRGFHDLKENLLPQLYRSGKRVLAYAARGSNPRVMGASSYLATNEWMVDQLIAGGAPLEGYVRSGESLIHRDAVIAGDAVFVGPVLVAPGARVLANALIVGPTSIGCDATVGRSVLVSRSAVWRRAVLGEHAVADRCILGDDAVVAAHTEAFRTVMASGSRRQARSAPTAVMPSAEPSSFELLRRMGRVLGGGTWSRSPAAQ
jgi:NDP-sugar pyrophosphorylase family protein